MSDIREICLKAFEDKFGTKPTMQEYAPGRVNIIGEHTDYNGGFVLPCAIKYGTCMVAKPNGTNTMRILAVDMNNEFLINLLSGLQPALGLSHAASRLIAQSRQRTS